MGESKNKSSEFDILVWITIIVVVAALASVVTPKLFWPQRTRASNACVNNLRQIDGAKNEWALETGKTNGAPATEADIKLYIKLNSAGKIPGCPDGGIYTIGKVGEPPTCSLATNGFPSHRLP